MERKEFIKLSALFGIGLSTHQVFGNLKLDKRQKVIIVGAGAAGLASAYYLKQLGIPFEILEASSTYGGRMKRTSTFTDFPVPLGAEWIHTRKDVFSQIVNDSTKEVKVQTKAYESDAHYGWVNKGKMVEGRMRDKDLKFVGSTWYDFFETYILAKVKDSIVFNAPVKWIDYSTEKIIVKTDDKNYYGTKVIVTAAAKVLQDGDIQFLPRLPKEKQDVIDNIPIWEGFKAFVEFKSKFYHTATEFKITPKSAGQKLYYDAAYGQKSEKNILGLFTVGVCAKEFYDLNDQECITKILTELDELYNGEATKNYVKHVTQNWGKEPFVKAAYVNDSASWRQVAQLGKSVNNRLYFAGGAYTNGENWENVHTAALAAKRTVKEMFG